MAVDKGGQGGGLAERRSLHIGERAARVVGLGHGGVADLADHQIGRGHQVRVIPGGVVAAEKAQVVEELVLPPPAGEQEEQFPALEERRQRQHPAAHPAHGHQHQPLTGCGPEPPAYLFRVTHRSRHRLHHQVAGHRMAGRGGLDAIIGAGEQRGQRVDVPGQAGAAVQVAGVDPVPGEVLDEYRGDTGPGRGRDTQRGDVAEHQFAAAEQAGDPVDEVLRQRVEPVQCRQGRLQILGHGVPLHQADVHRQGMDGERCGQRFGEQVRRRRGDDLEPHRQPPAKRRQHGRGPGGVTEAMGGYAAADATRGGHQVPAGRVTVKVLPSPGRLRTAIRPPCFSMMERAMHSPRPVPRLLSV